MNNKAFALLLIDKFILLTVSGICAYFAVQIALPPPGHVPASNETTLLGALLGVLGTAQGFLWSSLRTEMKTVFPDQAPVTPPAPTTTPAPTIPPEPQA